MRTELVLVLEENGGKSDRALFPCLHRKHSEGWENSRNLCKLMETRDAVEGLHNGLEFYQPFSCLDEAM